MAHSGPVIWIPASNAYRVHSTLLSSGHTARFPDCYFSSSVKFYLQPHKRQLSYPHPSKNGKRRNPFHKSYQLKYCLDPRLQTDRCLLSPKIGNQKTQPKSSQRIRRWSAVFFTPSHLFIISPPD
jgi:hypothetical protein